MMAPLPVALAFLVAMILAFPLWFVGAFYLACLLAVVAILVSEEQPVDPSWAAC